MNTLPDDSRFLWLDVETTGLDKATDLLLEVAWWPSRSNDPFDLDPADQRSFAIRHTPAQLAEKLVPVTWRMHGASGLLADVIESKVEWYQVNSELLSLLGQRGTWHLAGNSVHFDRGFLDEHYHAAAQKLHHRILDVSSVKMVARSMGMVVQGSAPAHRALDDVKASVRELAACCNFFARYGAGFAIDDVLNRASLAV